MTGKKEPVAVEVINEVVVEFLSDPVETGVRIVEMFVCLGGCEEEKPEDGAVVLELPSVVRLPVPVSQ